MNADRPPSLAPFCSAAAPPSVSASGSGRGNGMARSGWNDCKRWGFLGRNFVLWLNLNRAIINISFSVRYSRFTKHTSFDQRWDQMQDKCFAASGGALQRALLSGAQPEFSCDPFYARIFFECLQPEELQIRQITCTPRPNPRLIHV
ncbi:hypothetical protein K469DRAFT_71060 [Zopfia rhizophila CBS 207.26]|uniref:Uncharacterized protein n=1 Tax=Zopfia rhizophila CBS 207.26 TaxID=1314779 RepID=A0A6A6EDZ7_9PEZI|nr:hypothetical protein K469DRAFT_71060 [Zopfia rhizophila CBS 207.26]